MVKKKGNPNLKGNHKFCDAIINQIPELIQIVDNKCNILWVNKLIEKALGKNIIGQKCYRVYKDDKKQCSYCPLKKPIKVGETKTIITSPVLNGKTFEIKHAGINYQGKKAVLEVFRDITDQKQTEEELLESNDRFEKLFDGSRDAIFIADAKTRQLTDVNQSGINLMGYSKEKILSMKADKLHPKDLIKRTMEDFKRHAKNEIKVVETEVLAKDKKRIPVAINSSLIMLNGKPYLRGNFRDITDRKQSEEKLKESEEKYSSLFKNMLNGFAYHQVVTNKKGKPIDYIFLEINGAFTKITGIKDNGKLLGKKVTQVLPGIEKDPVDWIGKYGKVALGGKGIRFENYSQALNKWFSIYAFSPKKGYFATIFEDITNRKKAEQSLKESEDKLRNTIQMADLMAYDYRVDTGELFFSGATKKTFGYSEKELVGNVARFWEKDVHPEDQKAAYDLLNKCIKTGQRYDHEYRVKHKDGSYVCVEDHGNFILDEKGKVVRLLGTVKNITDKKKAENELKELNYLASQAQKIGHTGFLNWNMKTNDMAWSDEVYHMYNVKKKKKPSELFDLTMKLVHPDDFNFVKKNLNAAIHKGKKYDIEHRVLLSDGTVIWVNAQGDFVNHEQEKTFLGTVQNITERKKAEEALKNEKNRLDTTMESLPGVFYLFDSKGKFLKWNKNWEKVTGYSSKEMEKAHPLDFFRGGDKKHVASRIKETFTKGVSNVEANFVSKGGKSRPYYFTGKLMEINNKPYLVGMGIDITERKKSENELKIYQNSLQQLVEERTAQLGVSEKKHETLFLSSRDALMILAPPTWRFTSGNPATVKMFGCKNEKQFVSLGPWQVSPKKQPDGQLSSVKAKAMIMKAMKEGSNFFEWTHKKYKGEDFFATVLLTRTIIGEKTFLQATVRDITDIKNAEKEIKESEIKFKSIFDNVTVGILGADSKTKKFIFSNPEISKITGYSNKELLKLDVSKIHPKKDLANVISHFEKQMKGEELVAPNLPVLRKDGSVVYCDISSTPQIINKQKILMGIFSDVTFKKKAEEKLQKAYEQLKELDVLKSKFLTVTSHELKTPLTPAKIQTQMILAGDLGKLNEKQKQSFDIILRNINRLNGLIEDILEISRLEAGGFKLSIGKVKLEYVIKETMKSMVPMAKNKGVKLSYQSSPLPVIKADIKRITEVIINLVDNAIKFTDKGTISINAKKQGKSILVTVKDTGAGINEKNLKEIFTPFFQIEPTLTRKHGGTGLGLSIIKAIVEQHGGKIWVESKPNKGSTFYFTLPLKPKPLKPLKPLKVTKITESNKTSKPIIPTSPTKKKKPKIYKKPKTHKKNKKVRSKKSKNSKK